MRIKNKELKRRRHRKEQIIKAAQKELKLQYEGKAASSVAAAPKPKAPAAPKPKAEAAPKAAKPAAEKPKAEKKPAAPKKPKAAEEAPAE
ncbi:MAG TPA: hypothetical protein VGL56_00665 [Fimbriimonadaceae bacterium]|jgi:hypothetical protein